MTDKIVLAIIALIALPFVLYFLYFLLTRFFWFVLGLVAIISLTRDN